MVEASVEKKASVKPTKKKFGFKVVFLYIKYGIQIIIVLGLMGLFYFSWEQQNVIDVLLSEQNQLVIENENLIAEVQVIQQDFENINNTEASAEILFNQQNVRLDNLNTELVSLRLGMNANQTSGIWQIVEAMSMLRLAQKYLELNQDIPVALSLYQNSNAILMQIGDPALDRIKSLLASDIQNLINSRSIDAEGFYMRLNDLSLQLDNISLGGDIEPSAAFLEDHAENRNENLFNSFKDFLARYFTVRRLDVPIVVPLSSQQLSFLRQNMQLQLEQAKLALLQRRQAIYQDSLSNVLMLAQRNIPEQEQQKAYIIRTLRGLQGETILLNLSQLSESLRLLENLMNDLSDEPRD
ncbi:MAG: hypothetical protein COA71_02145 [SAR86 cluster bacterium]|uniref:HPt domain-containing protein n=1 Tax=SAR86 cluster bacterium TaxID=2030880 RepID=A0A2A5CJJ6_9GAMM|nr:MAG: hypothetical protein COA71_02145 [SAR86 cluster bacterium]